MENTASLTCKCCKTNVSDIDTFCPSCGFPLKGTSEEQGKFIGRYIMTKDDPFALNKEVKNARTTLGVVTGLMVLSGIIFMAIDPGGEGKLLLMVYLVVAAIFGFLTWWSTKNPFGALLTGLILYISLLIIGAVGEPESIVKGIIVKVLIIGYLVKGVMSSSKARQARA